MECLARVHVKRLTVGQRLSNFKSLPHSAEKTKGSIVPGAKSSAEQNPPPPPGDGQVVFLCVDKLQTLCSNSTLATLHLAVRVKTPDCKRCRQLKPEAQLQRPSTFLNSACSPAENASEGVEMLKSCARPWRPVDNSSLTFFFHTFKTHLLVITGFLKFIFLHCSALN